MTNFSHIQDVGAPYTVSMRSTFTAGRLVLVVEDHEDTRFLLRTLLKRYGIRVVEAADGVAGGRAAEEFSPHLILMDWSLPRMDGLAATRLIHEHSRLGHIPIVFLSGHATPARQQEALAAGCCDYLVKPIDTAQLFRVLEKHLLVIGE